jgi:predicted HAD superfamily Cof-like phosphohydrolase
MSSQSDYDKVRDFTIQAGQQVTDAPTPMNKEETVFLLRMALSELQELALTVTDNVEESVDLLRECVNSIDRSHHEKLTTEDEIIAAQADSIVDLWYYGLNAFAKKSVNLSEIFDTVHNANMAKRDPKTGKFIHRADGKIIKPEGWTAPDIVAEIKRQRKSCE